MFLKIAALLISVVSITSADTPASISIQPQELKEPPMSFSKEKIKTFYKDILEDQNIEKFDDYFTEDCLIEIGQRHFTRDTFKQRMQWLKDNTTSIKVEVTHAFPSQDGTMMTDRHISTAMDKDGKKHVVLNVQISELCDGKIKRFMLADNILSDDKETTVHYAK